MKFTTRGDVRELIRRLPQDHRAKSTWQHVEKQLNAATLGNVDTIDVAVPLQIASAWRLNAIAPNPLR
jgi:hypothetical protein